jgi:predicted short-subunit dehydrogenase-like oxidoreductase (DUF2520 family)
VRVVRGRTLQRKDRETDHGTDHGIQRHSAPHSAPNSAPNTKRLIAPHTRVRQADRASRPRRIEADVVILAVPDHAIAATAALLQTDALVVHVAGSRGVEELRGRARRRGVFHVLASLDGRRAVPSGCLCAWDVGGDDPRAVARDERLLPRLAKQLGLAPCRVRDDDRARYHAGAVIAGNLATALLHLGVEQLVAAGVDPDVARTSLARLLASTAERALHAPLATALTGPVARGDVETVERHLAVLPAGPAHDAYRLLTRVLVDAVRPAGARGRRFPGVR